MTTPGKYMSKSCLLTLIPGLLLGYYHATAESPQPPLPADVPMNKDVARGDPSQWLIVTVRLESGEELPLVVDTGSPFTVLDKSLEPKLGKPVFSESFELRSSFGNQPSRLYAAPKLYLGNVPLMMTGNCIVTTDLRRDFGPRIRGILGLDCLRNYCIQLDFEAGKMRFLDTTHLDKTGLGRAFPIEFSSRGQQFESGSDEEGHRIEFDSPYIHHSGLVEGAGTNLLIDTGLNGDGVVEKGVIKGHYLSRLVHSFIRSRDVRLQKCVWDGNRYTKLRVNTQTSVLGCNDILGLRFLARHLVTLDFPERMVYLKQTSTAPLSLGEKPANP